MCVLACVPVLPDKQLWVAFQMLHAVAQSHAAGVCHGDIKCENVVVTSWNWAFLTDFQPFKPTHLPADNPVRALHTTCFGFLLVSMALLCRMSACLSHACVNLTQESCTEPIALKSLSGRACPEICIAWVDLFVYGPAQPPMPLCICGDQSHQT